MDEPDRPSVRASPSGRRAASASSPELIDTLRQREVEALGEKLAANRQTILEGRNGRVCGEHYRQRFARRHRAGDPRRQPPSNSFCAGSPSLERQIGQRLRRIARRRRRRLELRPQPRSRPLNDAHSYRPAAQLSAALGS